MLSMLLSEDSYEAYKQYKLACHGKVFLKSELESVIEKYGLPKQSIHEEFQPGRYIIEAQIWDLEVINKYVEKPPNPALLDNGQDSGTSEKGVKPI